MKEKELKLKGIKRKTIILFLLFLKRKETRS